MRRLALVEPSTGSTTTTIPRSGWCRPLSSLSTPNPWSVRYLVTGASATRSRAYWPSRSPPGRQSSMVVRASWTTSTAPRSASSTASASTGADGSLRSMAVIDVAGYVAELKEHAVDHAFHVHDERHFV